MNKFKINTLYKLILLVTVIVYSSCKKDDYQPKGDYITQGTNNNTVKAYTYTVSSWTLGGTFWYSQCSLPSTVSMDGLVLVYIQGGTSITSSGSNLYPLPYTKNDIEYYYTVKPGISIIELDVRSASGSTSVYDPGTISYKIVVIPPAESMASQNINLENYNEVAKAFNLK